ncbi:MAG: GNAT family N-acetyltransferase [Caldilineaceae bacterium]
MQSGVPSFSPISEKIRPSINAYWSSFLACTEGLLVPTRTLTVSSPNSPGILGLQTQRHWLFAVAPGVARVEAAAWVRRVLFLLRVRRVWPTVWQPIWQRLWQWAVPRLCLHRTFAEIYGPAYVLYCSQVTPQASNAVTVRLLTAADQQSVQQFHQTMGAVVWQVDQPQLWPRLCGIFQDDHLVAAGAVRLWSDRIGEIFVDTLPQYRRRGYARALAHHLTDWVLRETPWLPQYDAEAHNLPSLRVAHAVGYCYYGMMLLGTL